MRIPMSEKARWTRQIKSEILNRINSSWSIKTVVLSLSIIKTIETHICNQNYCRIRTNIESISKTKLFCSIDLSVNSFLRILHLQNVLDPSNLLLLVPTLVARPDSVHTTTYIMGYKWYYIQEHRSEGTRLQNQDPSQICQMLNRKDQSLLYTISCILFQIPDPLTNDARRVHTQMNLYAMSHRAIILAFILIYHRSQGNLWITDCCHLISTNKE